MSYMRSLEKAFFSGEKGHICPLLLKNYNITLRLYYQSIYAPTIIKMAQLCPSFVNPIHFSHMACQLITPTLLLPPLKNSNNKSQDRRTEFALCIFKHCWFGSQPWMPIVAYALYMLYSKSISATAAQPEGKAWNFPLKQKRSCCSQAFCSSVNSFVSSLHLSSPVVAPLELRSKVLN